MRVRFETKREGAISPYLLSLKYVCLSVSICVQFFTHMFLFTQINEKRRPMPEIERNFINLTLVSF